MIKDMTQGSPLKLLLRFSVPLLIGNIFQQIYSFTDAAIVGKTLGYEALAAVGSTGAVMFLIFGFFFGLTSGLTVITGQRFGAGDIRGVRKSIAVSVIVCTVITLIVSVASVLLTPWILRSMNTPDNIYPMAYDYMVVMFYGAGTIVLYNLLSGILRALGDSTTPLVFLIVSCIINVALDLFFILVCGWGVGGAAWATVIAQALSGLFCLVYMLMKLPFLRLRRSSWIFRLRFAWEHLRISLPMAFQFSITAVGIVILQAVLNNFGAVYIAAVTVAGKMEQIALQPMFSFSVAIASFVAQNYGARDLNRIVQGTRTCVWLSLSTAAVMGVIVVLGTAPVAPLFMNEYNADVVKNALLFQYINAPFYFILCLLVIYRNVLQGMGYAFIPLMAGVAELFLRAFAALLLARAWGYTGVCIADPLAWIGATVLLYGDYFIVMRKLRRDGIPPQIATGR